MSDKPLLTIVIPCYNEIKTIDTILNQVQNSPILSKEIIIVDDGSTDGTREYLCQKKKSDDFKIIFHTNNKDKGAALATGISNATGEITIIQDADLEYDPMEYEDIIKPIIDDRADVVFGSRFQGGRPHRVVYFWHRIGNGFLTLLSNMFTDLNLSDMETCYKSFKTDIVKSIQIEEKRFGFEPEITAKLAKIKNIRFYEVGISYYGRTYDQGKKITWKDGIRAIICILKYNLF